LKNVYISNENSGGLICTKFGSAGLLAYLTTYDIYFGNRFRGFNSLGSNLAIFLPPGYRH